MLRSPFTPAAEFIFPAVGGDARAEHFDLTIPAGSSLAIRGQNGAARNHRQKLLCRCTIRSPGAIESNGVDLRSSISHRAVRASRPYSRTSSARTVARENVKRRRGRPMRSCAPPLSRQEQQTWRAGYGAGPRVRRRHRPCQAANGSASRSPGAGSRQAWRRRRAARRNGPRNSNVRGEGRSSIDC